MIYKSMDIGTGKPGKEELIKAPHALIDILDPKEKYSVASFCEDAYTLMEQSIKRKRVAITCRRHYDVFLCIATRVIEAA